MKLYARTPGGIGLGINVLLTGQVQEDGGAIRRVEIYMPIGCAYIVDYSIKTLPIGRGAQQLFWVDPGDLCADDGSALNQKALRAEAVRVNDQLRAEMLHGPLGEHWP